MTEFNKLPISKAAPELKSQDYAFLRQEGLDHIETLAKAIWTDYNAHDPGITMMELLAFAITDIGYRANLPIADILAPMPDAPTEKSFHTAAEVLVCNPVTILDFRKLLIDVDGVRNAWVIPTEINTPGIYLDCQQDGLTYQPLSESGQQNTKIPLRGLYNVMLELEEEEGFDDLNSSSIRFEDQELSFTDSQGDTYTFEIDIWAKLDPWDKIRDFDSIQKALIEVVINHPAEVGPYEIYLSVDIDQEGGDFSLNPAEVSVQVLDTTFVEKPNVLELEDRLTEQLNTLIGLEPIPNSNSVLSQYERKVARIAEIVLLAKDTMLQHRNLCEDVAAFKSLLVEEIGICADIELRPEAKGAEILEEIYYQISNFLSPNITFYSITEMKAKGYRSEEIFEGPALQNGFIDNEELIKADRRRDIHVSDLIQIIMDVAGVIAVRSITIANFPIYNPNNEISEETADWCLALAFEQDYVPRLTTRRSTFNFYKDDLPIFFNQEISVAGYQERLLADRQTSADVSDLDHPIPQGRYRAIETYSSIQEQLPQTYGVGRAGLSSTVSDARKAQAKQLQGYLLFFEQLIAGYFQQLAHVRDLFSMRPSVSQTYFAEPLTPDQAPGISALVHDFVKDHGGTPAEDLDQLYQSYLLTENNFEKDLITLFESTGDFQERRNRFLNHLLARFNEDFVDYSLLLFGPNDDRREEELIDDKLDFLRDYPDLSAKRGRGFHYGLTDELWDTENTTGMEIRLSRMLGLESVERRTLASQQYENFSTTMDENGTWYWQLKDPDTGEVLIQGPNDSEETAIRRIGAILSLVHSPSTTSPYVYLRKTGSGANKSFRVYAYENGVLTKIGGSPTNYSITVQRNRAYNRTVAVLEGTSSRAQWHVEAGLHIIEHSLLRPKTPEGNLMPVCETADCNCQVAEEPYSFRISVILPAEADKFTDMEFRRYVDRRIRMETPAHILPKICWISAEQMGLFEEVYREWLEAYAKATNTVDTLYQAQSLRVVLNTLLQSLTEHLATLTTGKEPMEAVATELLKLFKLELMEDDLRATANVNLDKAVTPDDLTRLWQLGQEEPDTFETSLPNISGETPGSPESVGISELTDRVLYAINQEFIEVSEAMVADDGAYSNLYYQLYAQLEAEVVWLTGLIREDLEPEELFRELVDHQYREEYQARLTALGEHADEFLEIGEETLAANEETAALMFNLRTQVQEVRYYIERYFLSWKLNRLLAVMASLRNVYPAAVLHDCDDDDGETPVMLGSTRLGTI